MPEKVSMGGGLGEVVAYALSFSVGRVENGRFIYLVSVCARAKGGTIHHVSAWVAWRGESDRRKLLSAPYATRRHVMGVKPVDRPRSITRQVLGE